MDGLGLLVQGYRMTHALPAENLKVHGWSRALKDVPYLKLYRIQEGLQVMAGQVNMLINLLPRTMQPAQGLEYGSDE